MINIYTFSIRHPNIYSPIEFVCVCVLVTQLCPTLCGPTKYSLPGFSVPGILQARILEPGFSVPGILQARILEWTALAPGINS